MSVQSVVQPPSQPSFASPAHSESLQGRRARTPAIINTKVANYGLGPREVSSPTILRDFDRYPAPGPEVSLRDNVNIIMSTAVSQERYQKHEDHIPKYPQAGSPKVLTSPKPTATSSLHKRSLSKNSRDSKDGKDKDRRKFSLASSSGGKIAISGPEGFSHVASMNDEQYRAQYQKQAPRRGSRENGELQSSALPSSTASPSSNKTPQSPKRSASGSRSVLSPKGSSANSSSFSTAVSTGTLSSTKTVKRASRFPWSKKQTTPTALPKISEPILASSTSGFVPDSSSKLRGITSEEGKKTSSEDREKSPITPTDASADNNNIITGRAYSTPPNQGTSSSEEFTTPPKLTSSGKEEHESYDFSEPPSAPNNPPPAPLDDSPQFHAQAYSSFPPKDQSRASEKSSISSDGRNNSRSSVHSSQDTEVSQFSPMGTDGEVQHYKQKLKEAEEHRRNVIIEYQRKLDAERQKTMALERKLEQLTLQGGPRSPRDRTMLGSEDLQTKVKSLESQRQVLREALATMRRTKDLEVIELQRSLSRRIRRPKREQAEARIDAERKFITSTGGIMPLLPLGTSFERPNA